MIYNLTAYLKVQLATINFIVNGWSQDSPEASVMLRQTGGVVQHWYDRTDWAVQIMSRSNNVVESKTLIDSVFNVLKNKFGITLPEVTVNAVVHAAVKTYQISPIQQPGYIGADEKHLEMWSVNFTITTD